ncbi:small ribosomal subunit protein eS10-like [Lepus europaeus]|uniref:small ribosomal subunit protein eS10-like n=1 Tax=Lepus europaeus TaxID=9983 RepID=UPI002B4A5BE3|nr:small ribosomal subunit protein eS10-like [Lepus europaeus]
MKEQFVWRHFYWYLTNEGIQYLQDYLHLPPEIVPATADLRPAGLGPKVWRGSGPHRRGSRQRYFQTSAVPPGADKKAEAGAGSATEFQSRGRFGLGRGQPPQ